MILFSECGMNVKKGGPGVRVSEDPKHACDS